MVDFADFWLRTGELHPNKWLRLGVAILQFFEIPGDQTDCCLAQAYAVQNEKPRKPRKARKTRKKCNAI